MAAFRADQGMKPRRIWPFVVGGILLSILLALFAVFSWYRAALQPVSGSDEEVVVTIAVGTTGPQVGETLESRGLIRSATAFHWYLRLNNLQNKMQAGGYKFTPNQSVQEIVQILVNGDVSSDLVTILPAQRLDEIKTAFAEAGYSKEEIETALDPQLYADHPALVDLPAGADLEGYLYPESFLKTAQTSLSDIVEASLDETAEALTPEIRQAYADKGLTIHQAIILASIVEREVSDPADREKVAQVFLKRYSIGMMLGSDPTALYGALKAGIEPTVFADTPYNTRLYEGLPPGPINNISKNSLRALAFPATTDYLYFVSGDDGNTYFSNTLEEHEALTERYCQELCNSY